MQFLHLPSYGATPLLVLLVCCCLGMACAGAIPKHHNRLDTRSQPSLPHTTDGKQASSRPEVEIARSRQRALLEKGKRTQKVIAGASDRVRDNGTVVKQRVIKRAVGDACAIPETVIVYHDGVCKNYGGVDFCENDDFLDMGNPDCVSGSR